MKLDTNRNKHHTSKHTETNETSQPQNLILKFEEKSLPKRINQLLGGSYWQVQKERKLWREIIFYKIKESGFSKEPLKRAKLILTRFSSRQPDSDGLVSTWKHVIDALVFNKVLVDDKYENIGVPDYRWEKAKQKEGKIRVEIYEL